MKIEYPIGVIFPDGSIAIKYDSESIISIKNDSGIRTSRGNSAEIDECRTVYKIENDGTFKMVKSVGGAK